MVGKVNIPFEPAAFDALYKKVTAYISNKEIYVRDSYVCADPNYRLNVE
jgi:phosphoenolpyruvate carboxykinase (ATP)